MNIQLNNATEKFVDDLKSRKDVRSIILFGSWARGNQRPTSDVDLIVVLDKGYKRAAETHYDQIFEIIYLTEDSALDYWKGHPDETTRLWEIAKILYDRDGTAQRLQKTVGEMIAKGKQPIDAALIPQLLFDAKDQLEYARYIRDKGDSATAIMTIENKVFALAQLYFDINGIWAPAPKQLLETIKNENKDLYSLLEKFYSDEADFAQKSDLLERITELVFNAQH